LNRRSEGRSRLERRDEREARRVGGGNAPRATRARPTKAGPTKTGLLGGLSTGMLAGIAGAILIAVILIYAVLQVNNTGDSTPGWVKAQLDSSTDIAGTYVAPHPGFDNVWDSDTNPGNTDDRQHVAPGTVFPICTQAQTDAKEFGNAQANTICYNSNPPTSGPHSSTPQGFSNLENPAPKENIVHSMEHGGVYIWYNTDDQDAIKLIKDLVNDNTDRRRFVGSTIYTGMEDETIAITSWTRIDKFPVSDLTKDRLQDFIDDNHKRFNPEGF
jgi:hypothetical protein